MRESALALRVIVRHSFDMTDSAKARAPILAAGGIVLREGSRPHIAVVRLRRDKSWVLPKGKLYPGEDALGAARREVMEETGYEVSVREFLGAMSYSTDGKTFIDARKALRAGQPPAGKVGQNTTIGVVATNARLTKTEATKVAQMAHDGIARAVYPAHTMPDGDTIFALATGRVDGDLTRVGALAADAMADAIVRGVRAAEGIPGFPAARDIK